MTRKRLVTVRAQSQWAIYTENMELVKWFS